jgi:hypothetical protein
MRNYLSSRSFKTLSVGSGETGNHIAGILNANNGDEIDCLKYAGYVINIANGVNTDVTINFVNLQPGAVFYLF